MNGGVSRVGYNGPVVTVRRLLVLATFAAATVCSTPARGDPLLSTQSATQKSASPDSLRLARVELWLKAVLNHEPGMTDDPAKLVAEWPHPDLRQFWLDLNVLVRLMRTPSLRKFAYEPERGGKATDIRYTPTQFDRMRVLACAASGATLTPPCAAINALRELDSDLRELAIRVSDARQDDADNFILRRGALLHADIAMLLPNATSAAAQFDAANAERFRVTIADGRQTALREAGIHWEIGRGLLAYVRLPNSERPAPGKDDMVRRWYVATSAWMQDVGDYETKHLDLGRDVFPTDPDLLFLSGCLHEVYASPPVQAVLQAAVLPSGVVLEIGGEGRELRQAETFFRRSLSVDPTRPETRLRLGRVLARLNRPADAARELKEAVASTADELLLYYGSLFLGVTLETLQQYDEAEAALQRAVSLYPTAQSPRLALSELARRRGNRADALREMQAVFELPWSEFERHDPWWDYDVAQARNVGTLLKALRAPFLWSAQ